MRLTASAMSRAEACIGSVVLDGYDESGEYAATGNAVDQFVQTAKTRSRDKALAEAPAELRPYLASLTLERIPDGAEYQVAFAFNVLTGDVRRIPGRGAGYPTDLGEEWIFGTADIVSVRDGRGLVIDLKWGTYTIGRDPATDLQLGFYALAVARIVGASEVDVGFSRAGWDGVLRPDMATLDEMALDVLEERIRGIWYRARAAGPPMLSVGEHCTYCRARWNCPRWERPAALVLRGDLAALAADPPVSLDVVRERLAVLTPEERGRVYEVCDEIEERAKLIRQSIRDDARHTPIPLSGGKELRAVMWGSSQSSPLAKE